MTYTPSTEQVRQWTNSYDGCPTDVFDRWLAAHDAEVRADERAKIAAAIRTMTIRGSGGFLSATNLRERAARIAEADR